MKKVFVFLPFVLFVFVFSSCNKDKIEKLQAENDSLRNLTNENAAQLQQFIAAFNQIQENLNTIKQKEHIITMTTTDSNEVTPDMKNQINNDILTIYQLMQENKQALAILKKKLKASNNKNKELQKTIALYEQQLEEKDQEIAQLKDRLAQMDFNIKELNKKIDSMNENIQNLAKIKQQQEQLISEQDKDLHTVYYIVGTKDELIQKGVISRRGFLTKFDLDPDFNKSYFTEADNRNLEEIPLNTKKALILTKHPTNSYILETVDKQVNRLIIKDKDSFWSLSKYCVILVK